MKKDKMKKDKMKKDKTNKTSILDRDISDLAYKTESIAKRYIGLILTVPAVLFLLLFCQPFNYPAESQLVFEECTFIRYEYKYYDNIKGADSEEYHIFVEEYDKPLQITDLAFDKADIKALQNIISGDKVTVSINHHHFDQLFLYSLSCENTYILSYDDYLSESFENDKALIILCICCIIFGIAFSLIDVIYKKVKGKSLFWRKSQP